MKLKKLFFVVLYLVSFSFYAQKNDADDKKEKIKAYKISFLTSELNLTSSQAEKFWPIYTVYDDKQFELRHEKMKAFNKKQNAENINNYSDKEATDILNKIEQIDDQLYSLRKKYMTNIKKILPAKKILLLKKSEDDFNRKLLQQYREKGGKK